MSFSQETPHSASSVDGTGLRHDKGKARFDLLPPRPLADVARVFTKGAEKYEDRNWEKGLRWGKHYAALQRHLHAYWGGEDLDPESGLPHLAHVVFGCLALMEYARTCPQYDDRVSQPVGGLGSDAALLATTPRIYGSSSSHKCDPSHWVHREGNVNE